MRSRRAQRYVNKSIFFSWDWLRCRQNTPGNRGTRFCRSRECCEMIFRTKLLNVYEHGPRRSYYTNIEDQDVQDGTDFAHTRIKDVVDGMATVINRVLTSARKFRVRTRCTRRGLWSDFENINYSCWRTARDVPAATDIRFRSGACISTYPGRGRNSMRSLKGLWIPAARVRD